MIRNAVNPSFKKALLVLAVLFFSIAGKTQIVNVESARMQSDTVSN